MKKAYLQPIDEKRLKDITGGARCVCFPHDKTLFILGGVINESAEGACIVTLTHKTGPAGFKGANSTNSWTPVSIPPCLGRAPCKTICCEDEGYVECTHGAA
jgi:hypothetical protein